MEATQPYEIKSQDASIPDIDSVDDPEMKNAMLRNQDIHHRNATYRGVSDMDLLLGYTKHGILGKNDMLTAKLGTTIPFGKTEEDPVGARRYGESNIYTSNSAQGHLIRLRICATVFLSMAG